MRDEGRCKYVGSIYGLLGNRAGVLDICPGNNNPLSSKLGGRQTGALSANLQSRVT